MAQVAFAQAYVEKSGGVFIYLLEGKPVSDVITGCGEVVIDMDFIADVFAESIIIGSAPGQLSAIVVGNDGNFTRVVGCTECVKICVVCKRISSDHRCFPVAGGHQSS